jgi:hypothetical protein
MVARDLRTPRRERLVARISIRKTAIGRVVTVEGMLEATDLKRFEHACGRALEHQRMDLVIVLSEPTRDVLADAYIAHLEARGAIVRRREDPS